MKTFSCHNCDGTGYIYLGGSTLDEDNYELCPHCDGYGFFEELAPEELDPELLVTC